MTTLWTPYTPDLYSDLPVLVRDWVALTSSMTARIGLVADSPIDVEVLRQTEAQLRPDEAGLLELSDGPTVVREVCLSAEGLPLLVARTAVTSQKLQAHPTIVKLGNKALGSLLFAGPKPCPYTAREFARLTEGDALFDLVRSRHSGAAAQSEYWARRTLFWLFDEPLLVTEIFLPELLEHPRAREV
ncbi:chorismate--pyruvate lyase family protein [Flavimaricola marinus]|uniref:Probable chorismate pyruvate-lyase n=1 Tax=Flavimaricola marinus TaxID=1819565 RepID=A0A238LI26_9RHOB|nr:chorismate lyase [Flavimaricola marinus]SMY09262.1 Chorismate pyruvate-lyase [Flavimaricola marinus]